MQAFGMRRVLRIVFTALTAAILFFVAALPAWAAESMTLTFVRHGESQANFEDRIDTSVPGPGLTPLGEQQAEDVALVLADRGFDGIYASNMQRTQLTAAPLADKLGQPVVVLPGLREISAGVFEGSPESGGLGRLGYGLAPVTWTLGARFVPVLGAPDGNAFDARVDNAIQTIYDNGDRNAVAFSHGATIMFWVMMNVDNPDLGLLLSHPLDNTGIVVVTGNPEDGWLLEEWDGVAVSADPPLLTKLLVDVRDLVTAPQTALYNIGQAFASGDIAAMANAVRDGVVDVVRAVVEFVPNVVRDIVDEVRGPAAKTVDEPVTVDAAPNAKSADPVASEIEPDKVSPAASEVEPEEASPVEATPETEETQETQETDTVTALTRAEKSNGATDLTNGNKVKPGDTIESVGVDVDAGSDTDADARSSDLKGLITELTDRIGRTTTPGTVDDQAEADAADTSADVGADTDSDSGGDSGSQQAAA